MCCIRRHGVTKTRSSFLKMFSEDVCVGDELGDGITSSMSILYDLDAGDSESGPVHNNSWDWKSNLGTPSSNTYSSGQQMIYEQGMTAENGGRSLNSMTYQEPNWNGGHHSSVQQMYDQKDYNQYATQQFDGSYVDSSKHGGQMQTSYDKFYDNYNQCGRNPHWLNTPYPPQPFMKVNNNSHQQHGLHQRNVQQSFGTTSSGANYKILPSKKFTLGNFSQLGQKGILNYGLARKSLGTMNQGQQHVPLQMKNNLGGLGHGLIKIVSDNTVNSNKHLSLAFHDPPYQRPKPLLVQPPANCSDSEKPFSPTVIELVSASTDDDNPSTPPSPRVIEAKTAPVRNAFFGYKKLKYRCTRCGNRDATFNSQLTHVKSHRKPYCMHCCWIGDHALQLKAHIEKAHPKIDSGSGTTMVTSKYGRKCQVNSSVAIGLKRKKTPAKSPQKSTSNPADEGDEKPEAHDNLVREIKTEHAEKDEDHEEPKEADAECRTPVPKMKGAKGTPLAREPSGAQVPVKMEDLEEAKEANAECFTPLPKRERARGNAPSGTKFPEKTVIPLQPTRELSKRRLALMAKRASKEGGTPPPKEVDAKDATPPSKKRLAPKEKWTPSPKKDSPKDETPLSKKRLASKDRETPPPRVREMPKRELRKKSW